MQETEAGNRFFSVRERQTTGAERKRDDGSTFGVSKEKSQLERAHFYTRALMINCITKTFSLHARVYMLCSRIHERENNNGESVETNASMYFAN